VLHSAAWSFGDARIPSVGGARWQVDASKDGHTIIARAPARGEAWQLGCAQALGIRGTSTP
jgi:hypothetical protein